MRVLAIVAGEVERDAALAAFDQLGLPRLARLAPYPATRVCDCGAGTLVVVPAGGPDLVHAAVAAGVGANRTLPDLVLALDLGRDLGLAGDPAGADRLLALAYARLPGAVRAEPGPIAAGSLVAAQVHTRPFLGLCAPLGQVAAAVGALLARDLSDLSDLSD